MYQEMNKLWDNNMVVINDDLKNVIVMKYAEEEG